MKELELRGLHRALAPWVALVSFVQLVTGLVLAIGNLGLDPHLGGLPDWMADVHVGFGMPGVVVRLLAAGGLLVMLISGGLIRWKMMQRIAQAKAGKPGA